ncbi:short chain dehydrogenase [Phytophthora infestans]|uniref:Short chain dehydrogenase n=1 Tax=Phytophthora infestans TaxID=4787 RepID=A0A833WFQ1_PHYIN|nr:short chain dehydrogenase [Phytophthora infestans]
MDFLWARDEDGLKETAQLVQDARNSLQQAENLQIFIQSVDLSESVGYTKKVDNVLAQWSAQYDTIFLVHNAGALGSLGFAQECPLPSEMARHFELNVTSVMWLNKRFLDSEVDYLQRVVESAIAPYSTLSQYCTAKAAREMHFRVLATEQAACNKVRVFSYAPGAMDTEMQQSMRESPLWAPELTHWFVKMKEEGALIPIQQSSQRAVVVAVNGDFESGKYVSFERARYNNLRRVII